MNEEKPQPEQIRSWYNRTTKLWRRIICAGIAAVVTAVSLWVLADLDFLTKLQTFNGAMVIPVAAGIWMVSFIFIFLVPNREVGFRSQEALDRMEDRLQSTIQEHLKPALEVWTRVGKSVEKDIGEGIVKTIRETVDELRETAKEIRKSATTGEEFAKKVGPTMEALERVAVRVEGEIESGIFEDAKIALESLRGLGGLPPGAPKPMARPGKPGRVPVAAPVNGPSVDVALKSLRKSRT